MKMPGNPDVTVVISTYNRCASLPSAIENLLGQQSGDVHYEIIIVDNNSTDRTRQVVESYIAQWQSKVRYIFEGRQGLSYGRNAGLAVARAPIIAFTDDDVQVAADWIWQIHCAFERFPQADFVGGRVLPCWSSSPDWIDKEKGLWSPLALTDYGDQPIAISREALWCLVGANFAFRRAALESVGGFRVAVQRVRDSIGSLEDHEMLLLLVREGRVGWYVPEMLVMTDVPPERVTKDYFRRWYSGHGRFSALIRLEESFDKFGHVLDAPPEVVTLFGTPPYLYRRLLSECHNWVVAGLRRQSCQAFTHELKVRELLQYIRQRRRMYSAEKKGSILTDLRRLALGQVRRRFRLQSSLTEK